MSYYQPWKQLLKYRQKQFKETEKNIKKILKKVDTQKKFLSDFPAINNYLLAKYPNVDVSDVPIYMVSTQTMDAAGFAFAAGFYQHEMRLVVVKRKVVLEAGTRTNAFEKQIQKLVKAEILSEDVIVHEMIHAISGEANRDNRRFMFNEEEFVYTNSIDFYKNKGMSDTDIVNKNFLPFCMQDVLSDKNDIQKILQEFGKESGIECPVVGEADSKELNRFLNRHAQKIVPILINMSRDRGYHMINLYNQYGRGIELSSIAKDGFKNRGLNLDMEW